MLYILPTKGAVRYTGAYPERIRSVSASNSVVHVETQDGTRYVGASHHFIDLPRYGKALWRYVLGATRDATRDITITAPMYAALVEAAQLRNQGTDKGAVRALLAKWDAVFGAALS